MSQTDELEQVTAQIEAAFAETPYPGDENIGWGCGSEGLELEKAFQGKHWKELTLNLILEYCSEIPCTTAEGFRFYLPAWMLGVLLHYDKVDVLSEFVVFNLSPPYDSTELYHFLQHTGGFNRQEKAAILSFLEALLRLYPLEWEYDLSSPPEHRSIYKAIEFWKSTSQGE
jgi:hypothetical protein